MAVTELWLVRHGESVANRAATLAEETGVEVVAVDFRDADVPLSGVGEQQAHALGRWLGGVSRRERPTAAWCSPYLRARETAAVAIRESGDDIPLVIDERLRDRELGVLDLLTSHGVEARFPGEAERRRWLGKFYYRPPGGESWADVALRIRSLLVDLDRPGVPERVLLVAHDAVVMSFLYVCTGLAEADLLEFAQTHTVANASVTRMSRPSPDAAWSLDVFSFSDHLEAAGVPVTLHEGDRDVQPR
jgi:broad specificity phosphatase PhoE